MLRFVLDACLMVFVPYAQPRERVIRHGAGKHKQGASAINLITLMWTDGNSHIPWDSRLYNKQQDGLTKNDHR